MTITVKVVSPVRPVGGKSPLARQLTAAFRETSGLAFTFDPEARAYDWLVVYENLPPAAGERRPMRTERLACPRANTILLTTEPSSIKLYDSGYTDQFGHVVTSQEPIALVHPGRIWSQAGLRWFYGESGAGLVDADTIMASEPEKIGLIATVCSTKRQSHTLHRLRYDFTAWLSQRLPALEVFGKGRRPVADKAEAVAPYRYHLAIENHLAPHHFTEKLADAFLGLSLPFYFGAPDAADYFPADSFIPVDIRKAEETLATIEKAIADDEYTRRLPALREARRRVVEEHSLFPLIARVIASGGAPASTAPGGLLHSQRAVRRRHPIRAIADFGRKEIIRARMRWAMD